MLFSQGPDNNQKLREAVYNGDVFKLPVSKTSQEIVSYVSQLLRKEVGETIERVHSRLNEEKISDTLRNLRLFIAEDTNCRKYVLSMMSEVGFLPSENAFDALRLRCVIPGQYKNAIFSRTYSVHRDTWYANPQSQINWWIALHDIPKERSFSFFSSYFAKKVENTSFSFKYDDWINQVGWQNTRGQVNFDYPHILKDLDPQDRKSFSCKAGEIILFSSAHLHQTNRNDTEITRFSLDFRTVHLGDHHAGKGALNVDNESSPDALRDYIMPEGVNA